MRTIDNREFDDLIVKTSLIPPFHTRTREYNEYSFHENSVNNHRTNFHLIFNKFTNDYDTADYYKLLMYFTTFSNSGKHDSGYYADMVKKINNAINSIISLSNQVNFHKDIKAINIIKTVILIAVADNLYDIDLIEKEYSFICSLLCDNEVESFYSDLDCFEYYNLIHLYHDGEYKVSLRHVKNISL